MHYLWGVMSISAVIISLALYVAILALLAWFASRKADDATFHTGNRNQRVGVVLLGMISGAMSGVTFVSVPGMVLTQGFTYMQMTLGFFVGQIIIATVLVPLYYRLGVVSIYEYLAQRFSLTAQTTGGWFFFVGKLLGTAVKVMLVAAVLQTILFEKMGVAFGVVVGVMMAITWLYTRRAGVKSVVWSDALKTVILLACIVVTALCIAHQSGLGTLTDNLDMTIIDTDPDSPTHFLKHFIAGVVIVVAMTGMDQDMMQRTLSCKTPQEAKRNVLIAGSLQVVVIAIFLALGAMMYGYLLQNGEPFPQRSDDLFPMVATSEGVPTIVGALFVIGIAAASFGSIGSALTSLTTSFVYDISRGKAKRGWVHIAVAIIIGGIAVVLYRVGNQSAIDITFRLAAYTYGPILGLFTFGLLTRRTPRPRAIPIIAIVAPLLTFGIAQATPILFDGFRFGHDILVVNSAIMFVGLLTVSRKTVILHNEKQ